MAQRNIENEIKKQLQARKIEPSARSWELLSAKLDANGEKSNKYWWLGIAAAVAVGIFIGSVVFNNPTETEPQVVETPVEIILEESEEIQLVEKEKNNFITEKPHFSEIKKPVLSTEKQQVIIEEKSSPTMLASEVTEDPKGFIEETQKPLLLQPDEEIAINAEIKPEYSIESEVDDLLAQAQKEIILNRSYNQEIVNSQSLLQDVEADIDRSFRNEVFEMIKHGFSNIKIAMAEKE